MYRECVRTPWWISWMCFRINSSGSRKTTTASASALLAGAGAGDIIIGIVLDRGLRNDEGVSPPYYFYRRVCGYFCVPATTIRSLIDRVPPLSRAAGLVVTPRIPGLTTRISARDWCGIMGPHDSEEQQTPTPFDSLWLPLIHLLLTRHGPPCSRGPTRAAPR